MENRKEYLRYIENSKYFDCYNDGCKHINFLEHNTRVHFKGNGKRMFIDLDQYFENSIEYLINGVNEMIEEPTKNKNGN